MYDSYEPVIAPQTFLQGKKDTYFINVKTACSTVFQILTCIFYSNTVFLIVSGYEWLFLYVLWPIL